jgi:D-Tyr-tRNAtyr deacylase
MEPDEEKRIEEDKKKFLEVLGDINPYQCILMGINREGTVTLYHNADRDMMAKLISSILADENVKQTVGQIVLFLSQLTMATDEAKKKLKESPFDKYIKP